MKYLKEFKTFSQQIALLESRGIVFNNITKQDAEEKLANISYYKLSGYIKAFEVGVDQYNGTDFKEALDLYYFDRKLSRFLFEIIERIEIAFKTSLAYYIAEYIEQHSSAQNKTFLYLNIKNWTHGIKWRNKREELKNELKFKETITSYTSRSNIEGCISYYFNKYNEEHFIPIWMLIEVIDFGVACNMYEDANNKIRVNIAKKFKISHHETLATHMKTLKFVRNRLAHNGAVWNLKLINRISSNTIPANVDNSSIFAVIVLMVELMKSINKDFEYDEFKNLIKNFFKNYPSLLRKFGILNNDVDLIQTVLH